MMARFPAPMAGWSMIVPMVVDAIVTRARPAMPDRVPAGHHGLLGGAVVFFGVHPEDQAALRGAEHRGRRLGRPPVRGRRVGDRVGLPGRRPQRLDRGHRAQVPGAGGRPVAAAGFRRRRQVSRRPRHRHAGAQPGRGRWNFEHAAAAEMSALGHLGRHGRRVRRLPAAAAGRERLQADGGRRTSRCRSTRRRSCAPAAAAAGAIRSSAIPSWFASTLWRNSFP